MCVGEGGGGGGGGGGGMSDRKHNAGKYSTLNEVPQFDSCSTLISDLLYSCHSQWLGIFYRHWRLH